MSLSREEALEEVARLRKRLERRERRARKREEMRAKIERSNREWEVVVAQVEEQEEEEEGDCGAMGEGGGEATSAGFVLASQLPQLQDPPRPSSSSGSAPKRLRSTQGRRRRTSRFLGPAAGGLLDGLEARDANRLVSDDGYVHGYTFRMPQPNAERMLRTVDFSLPRDYTSLKLEMNRTREVLAASSSRADEEQDMGQEVASQSILDTSGGARKRKRRETSGEENIKAGEALRREQDALQEDFGTLDVGDWSQFPSTAPQVDDDEQEEGEFLYALLGTPPREGEGWERAKLKQPLFRFSPVKLSFRQETG